MAWAQADSSQPPAQNRDTDTPVYPTTGVRFVVCSPSDKSLPSPLFALYKDKYLPIYISSRGPSERVLPSSDGHVRLYEHEPEDTKQPGDPSIDIALPPEMSKGRVICIALLAGEKIPPQYFFMREADFPVGGFYVLNFSPVPIEMVAITTPGQIPEKGAMIFPFKRTGGNCISPSDKNVWSILSKDHPGLRTFDYMLRVPPATEGETPMPLRGSRYAMSKALSHVTIIVKHPTQTRAFRLISFSYNSEYDKKNAAANAPRGRRQGTKTTTPR